MISQPIIDLLNEQLSLEQTAHLFYTGLRVWADLAGFDGVLKWAQRNAGEELEHRDKFIAYMTGLDVAPELPTVTPPTITPGIIGVFAQALDLEKQVTLHIRDISVAADAEDDILTGEFLLWFIAEQRASIAELLNIQRVIKLYGSDVAAIDLRIKELA